MTMLIKELSNPFSTGGGGGNFETRIQAAFVVLMLTGRISPCLPPWPIKKIKLQGRYADYNVDDFIVFVADTKTGVEAKLLAQIKHTVSITEGNDIFGEVIQAAWNDFNDPAIFAVETDAFALITGPLSASDINNTRSLLEWARHSENEKEFLFKVNRANFSNDAKRAKLRAFQVQLKTANAGVDVPDKQLWRFLKGFHLIGYDIDMESGSIISLLQSLIAQSSTENVASLWSRVVCVIQSYNQDAGTITLANLPKDICNAFNIKPNNNGDSDVKKLIDHSNYIIEGIRNDIAGVRISRPAPLGQLLDKSEEAEFVFLSGERGCGKSSLVREFAEYMKNRAPVFCLRTEDLDEAHLDTVFSAIGLKGSLSELEACFALMPKKYLIIESLEKLLELKHTTAFTDLMHFLRKHCGWTIIASGRDYAYQQITFTFLRTTGVHYSSILIKGFDNDDIQYLCEKLEILKPFAASQSLRPLLSNPFFADLAFRVLESGAQFSYSDGEMEFRAAVWRDVISKEKERSEGMPIRRKRTFVDIATRRAKLMVYGISEMQFDSGALLKLEEDNLIRRNSIGLVSPAHDVLEDWALERYIDEIYQINADNVPRFLDAVGHEPAMNRAFRLWLHQKMRCGENVTNLVLSILNCRDLETCWQDETISAILLGDNAFKFLNRLKELLVVNDGELLKRFCFILRIACKEPDQDLTDVLGRLYLKPHGLGWEAMISFILWNKNCISKDLILHITAVLYEWSSLIHIEKELPSLAREAGLLALHLLNMVKDTYREEDNRKKLLSVIFKVVPVILDEFHELIEADLFKIDNERQQLSYIKDFCEMSLIGLETAFLCKYDPDTVIKLAFHEWLIDDSKRKRHQSYGGRKDVGECFGLHHYKSSSNFFPASGAKGPFIFLLRYHPRKGMDHIIRLVNLAADKYIHSDLDLPERYSGLPFLDIQSGREQVEIPLNDGTIVKQHCSARLWFGYRGHSVVPYLLQSALMAMENWLIELAKNSTSMDTLEWIFDYILRNSNSVMLTALLASVVTGFPRLGKSALPLLKVPEFYYLDLLRSVREHGGKEVDWFKTGHRRNSLTDVYSNERREAALRSWRQATLESLIVQLQFTDLREEVLAVIDELRLKVPSDDEKWRFRFHRIDSRGWEPIEDKEGNKVFFTAKNLDADLQEIQQNTQEDLSLKNRFFSLQLWSEKTLKKEHMDREYYAGWLEALVEAKNLLNILQSEMENDLGQMHHGSITKTAAILLQDHVSEMGEEDCLWCAELLMQAVLVNANTEDRISTADRTDHNGAAAAASVLPILLDIAVSDEEKTMIKQVIAAALTHVNEDVRRQASNSIRRHMWQRDSHFAQNCIMGSIEYARLELEDSTRETQKRWHTIVGEEDTDASDTWLVGFRKRLACEEIQYDVSQISFMTHSSWHILSPCLMIPDGSIEISHILLFSRVLDLLFEAEESRNRRDDESEIDIDDELPMNFSKRFAGYLISLSEREVQLFIDQLRIGCETAPDFVQLLLFSIAVHTEKIGKKELYWRIWKLLSVTVRNIAISLSQKQDRRYISDAKTKLIRSMLYADTPWQKVDYENQEISLGKDLIIDFVTNAGMNHDVFESMASLMYHFPNVFFEDGLHILAGYQKRVGGIELVSGNAAFYLESSIQRYLLTENTKPLTREVHQSCWVLLDGIIETASSLAYYLREHLMRPQRIANGL